MLVDNGGWSLGDESRHVSALNPFDLPPLVRPLRSTTERYSKGVSKRLELPGSKIALSGLLYPISLKAGTTSATPVYCVRFPDVITRHDDDDEPKFRAFLRPKVTWQTPLKFRKLRPARQEEASLGHCGWEK